MNRAKVSPADIVARAYRAANRRRFADANRHLTLRLRNMFHASARNTRVSNARMTAILPRIKSADERARLQQLVQGLRQFEDPNFCWKGSTQGGSIRSIEVVRAQLRKRTAFVKVALRLADGRVRVERSRLVWKMKRWFIDAIEVEVQQNNEVQLARSGHRWTEPGPRS
jgi:hypothetical protein